MPRREHPSPQVMTAWRAFLGAHRDVVAQLDRDLLDRHDLPLDWYDVLVQLHDAGGEATMGELASRMLIAASTCTRIVERMRVAGLVERRVDDADHRVRHARLTPAGRARLRAAAGTHLAGIQRYFGAHLSETEAAQLAERLDAMRRSATD